MDQDISRRGGQGFDLPSPGSQPPPLPDFEPAIRPSPDSTVTNGLPDSASTRPLPDSTTRHSLDGEAAQPLRASGASTNGNGAKPKDPPSLFWQQPIAAEEEVNWFVPPLPRREEQGEQVLGLLNDLDRMVPHMPMRSWLTRWNYHTRSAASAAEQVDVEREAERRFAEQCARGEVDGRRLDEMIQSLEGREQTIEGELTNAQKEFAEAAACAGLSCEPDPKRRQAPPPSDPVALNKRLLAPHGTSKPAAPSAPDPISDLNYAPSGINPQSVEEALQFEVPDLDAVAGAQGVSPIPRHTLWNTILTFFMQFLAPLVCGFMLALCLGTLVGILDLDDFSRRDSVPKFALAAALGFVIVYLMGELFANTVHALTRTLEMRAQSEEDYLQSPPDPMIEDRTIVGRLRAFGRFPRPATPRLRAGLGIATAFLIAALFLGLAEVTAEGYGIRELHHQQIARRMRFRNPNLPPEEELFMPLYLLIGTLISGPYIMYKASKSWGESDIQLREAWLLHKQRNWIDDRRARPETGLAFQAACRVEQLENSLYDIKIQLKTLRERRATLYNPQPDTATQVRRKEARAAAVGEALRLQTMIEEMVNVNEPFPTAQPAPPIRTAPEAQRTSGARVTYTNR
jgi:hypothetical protein